MNYDENKPEGQKEIGPELEARIVAWVAGEASAFEAAELERLAGERPELAIFKRRIAAVQGLVAEAVRPEKNPLRLSPERRASLLQTIGAAETADATPAEAPKIPWLATTWRKQQRELRWMYAIAACGVLGFFLFYTQFSNRYSVFEQERESKQDRITWGLERQKNAIADTTTAQEARKAARRAIEENRERQALRFQVSQGAAADAFAIEMPTSEPPGSATDGAVQAPTLGDVPTVVPNATYVELPALASPRMLAGKGSAARSVAPMALLPAAPQPPPAADYRTGTMEPFVVQTEEDQNSYMAASTLAGSRVRVDLKDIDSAIDAVTGQFLQDTMASDAPGNATPARVGGKDWAERTGDINQTVVPANTSAVGHIEQGQVVDSLQSGSGGSTDIKGRSFGGKSEEEVVLSPFVLNASEDQGYRANPALAGTPMNEPLNGAVSAGQVMGKSEAHKKIAGPTARDDDKPAKAAARPVPPAEVSAEVNASREPVSTFSLHVSDASFRLAEAALARGEAPDPATVRPEEFYNAFDYGDPAPAASEKIACRIEQAAHPILQQRNLVRIAMRIPATGRGAGQPLRLTILLDTSGSMEREDRAASVHRAMEVLVSLLGANDRVTLIGFARQPRLLAEEVPGNDARQILDIVSRTPAEGGTNIEEALKLGGELARRHLDPQAQNRIVILTDGAANLGDADPARLATAIETLRQQGISFDACGVGTDGLDDAILEALTRKGDGRYYILDSPESADVGFARQLAGAFRPAAENVKVQVRFNPARVGNYRLIGFEHHRLRTEDFRNDKVAAAELAAEEAAVALYQVEPLPQGEGELGEVYVRFRDAATRLMVERSWTMTYEPQAPAFERATPTMQLAGTAALLAEKLQGGAMAGQIRLDELAPVMNTLRGRYEHEVRVQQLVAMYEQLRRLEAK